MHRLTLEGFADELAAAYGDAFVAAVLYGSAASGEYVTERSDHNILVIVRSLTPALLRQSAAASKRWGAQGNPPPLVLTEAEWQTSRDVFAMEMAEIFERHRVIRGALPEGPRSVDVQDLRHQLEFEAMGKLIRLRQAVLACEGDAGRELELLAATKSAMLVLFRTLLRAHGEPSPAGAEEVVRAVAARVGFDPAPFLDVVAHATGRREIPVARADEVLAAYHAGLERFVAHVDAFVAER